MLLAGAIMIGSLLLWTVLLFRKAALLLVAVFAPVAFAGYGWDQTRMWARRWIEAVVALVFCKVVIVVVFVLGASAFGTDGTTSTEGAATGCGRLPVRHPRRAARPQHRRPLAVADLALRALGRRRDRDVGHRHGRRDPGSGRGADRW